MTSSTKLVSVLFLLPALAMPKLDVQLCGTYPGQAAEEVALHKRAAPVRLRLKSTRSVRAGAPAAVRDLGDIALINDSEGVVAQRNPFNMDRRSIRFFLSDGRYAVTTVSGGFDADVSAQGSPVAGIGDDDTRPIALPFAFPYFSRTYSRVFLNSDGNLTFDQGDSASSERSLGRLTAGPPRIAPFFADLDPAVGGEIRVTAQSDRFTVTWERVPDYDSRGAAPNTLQVTLRPDGTIEFAYEGVTTRSSVVGIAPGALANGTSIISFASLASRISFPGAIVERFASATDIDTVFVAQKFLETHDDAYDYLVIYNNLGIPAAPGAVAFENTVRSDRLGIGDPPTDIGREYGSPRRLQAVLNMGPLTQYPRDPNAIVPSRATARDTPLTVLAHEAGHLWLAFASVRDPAGGAPMLGRQSAHWAFTFNSEASILEGNRIQDNGPGAFPRFRTVATVEEYAPLDQYLMGLRPAAEVPSTFYVANPSIGNFNRSPQPGVSFDGERRDVSVEDIVAAVGPRLPDHTVSQRRFRFAFILITADGVEPSAEQIGQLEGYRQAFEPFFERVTGGRAFADTRLRRDVNLSLAPGAGVVAGGQGINTSVSIARPAEADLSVLLRAPNGLIEAPRSVTIPAGQAKATFALRGVRVGVEEFTAEPADSRYITAHARVQVLDSPASLRLIVVSGDKQSVPAAGALAQPIVVKAADANNLPYPGIAVTASVADGGSVTPAQAVTGEDGLIRFTWTPGPNPQHLLRAAIANGASAAATAIGKPAIGTGGVVNSASLAQGVVPGAFASIFGASLAGGVTARGNGVPLPDRLGGVTVTLGGRPVGLHSVSDGQINFLAPESVPYGTAELSVRWGSESVTTNVQVRPVQPGIFSDGGTGLGAITLAGSADLTNVRPPAAGEIIVIYGTGFGPTRSGAGTAAGLLETVARPRVLIGGREAEILFSGVTPGIPGLNQVNARVPAGLAAGLHAVTLSLDGAASNGVQIRVR